MSIMFIKALIEELEAIKEQLLGFDASFWSRIEPESSSMEICTLTHGVRFNFVTLVFVTLDVMILMVGEQFK